MESEEHIQAIQNDNNGWDHKVELLLDSWRDKISINEAEHKKLGFVYHAVFVIFGITSIVLNAASLTAIINAIAGTNTTSQKSILIAVAIFSGLNIAIDSIDRFLNLGSLSEKHYNSAKSYNSLANFIDATKNTKSINATEFVMSVQKQFRDVLSEAPTIHNTRAIRLLDLKFKKTMEESPGVSSTGHVTIEIPDSENPEKSFSVLVLERDKGISNGAALKFREGVGEERTKLTQSGVNSGLLSNLQYQWERMARSEDETPSRN